jgi:hypothetical protein
MQTGDVSTPSSLIPPYFLKVNHIPSLTCLPGLWEEYVEVVVKWIERD